MALIPFFNKPKKPVLIRCTYCEYELEITAKEVRQLKRKYAHDPVCPIKAECDICHIGFMIPVDYVDRDGKCYIFNTIKPAIKNLDPDTVMDRIFENADGVWIQHLGPPPPPEHKD
jgi:hypothetical protein